MADKTIESLPSVTNVDENIEFPVQQGSTAMKMTVGDIANYVVNVSGGDATFIDFNEYGGATTVSTNASEIYSLVTNNTNVKLKVKTGADEYVIGRIISVSKSSSSYSAFFEVEQGADVVKKYVVDQNGNCFVSKQYDVAVTNGNTTFADQYHLSLDYTPSAETDAVNKGYVDDAIENAGGVSSVNNQTGDVTLDASDVGALADDAPVLMSTAQTLTEAQKVQARANIGAASSTSADIIYDIYAELHIASPMNYYTFGHANSSTIFSALNRGLIPVARNNDNTGGTLKKKWFFSEYQDDGEDVYIQFFRVTRSGVEVLRYVESEGRAYVSTV